MSKGSEFDLEERLIDFTVGHSCSIFCDSSLLEKIGERFTTNQMGLPSSWPGSRRGPSIATKIANGTKECHGVIPRPF